MTEVYDASDAKAVQDVRKKAKVKEDIAKEGLKTMMGTEPGRAWLYKFLMACDPFTNAFSPDPSTMAFRCGEINIGLQLIADMNEASPELYLQTLKENK